MYAVKRYFVTKDEGNFIADVWEIAGSFRANVQQMEVDEYRARRSKRQNTETIAVHSAIEMLIEDYNL